MKKNKILISFVVLLTLISAACTDDGKEDYLDEFDTILYFRNSGELPATFYATGDDAVYELIVNKAGVNRSAVATVDVQSLTDEALAQYNAVQRTDYKALPQDCYEYDAEKLSFLSSDSYKDVRVTLKTDKIGKLQKTDAANYVIPLQLCNGTDSVNAQKQYAFIIPEVHIPTIGFENSGYVNKTLTNDESKVETVSTNIVLPVKDVWGVQCELEIDKAALDLFNKESGMNYELLQEEYYQLKKTIIFENGKMIAPVEILIDKTVMNYGTYVLPLTITSVSKDDFEMDEAKKTILLGISLIPPSIALTAKMLSTNALEPTEGALSHILDGDIKTYFHSAWSVPIEADHYVQVALDNPVRNFVFNYTTRNTNGNAAPGEMFVSVSADGKNFDEIKRFTIAKDGLPVDAATSWRSPSIKCDTDVRFIRFTNVTNASGKKYFVWSEFSLAGK